MKNLFPFVVILLCFSFVAKADDNFNMTKVRAAAEQGEPVAQSLLGMAYHAGSLGLKRDDQESLKWLSKSAVQGYPPAQVSLGAAYANGWGTKRDNILAYKWFSLAAATQNKKYDDVAAEAAHERDALPPMMTDKDISQSLKMIREVKPYYDPADEFKREQQKESEKEDAQRQMDQAKIDQEVARRRALVQQQQTDQRIQDLEDQNARLQQQQRQMMGYMGEMQDNADRQRYEQGMQPQ